MYIYNITINMEKSIVPDWLNWMKTIHIPDVMSTGLFLGHRLMEVMVEEEQGITYSVQYDVKDLETLKLYQEVYSQKLQAEHLERYRDKFVAFRTILRLES